ncbi:glycoside-pentoside-hexuronide (GPH):cation symporter [Leuconostoc citreum]|uniref:Sodium:galactoside symporter n=2 Tax=Bacteria TaxID=2 RepID=B1MYP2_LEUCK|nr:glycoside-pentoside-hexuronide (GPH):cation symporter [Leuconostoc citreum]ACA82644.1 Sodium:galactoside symporter [Leuconostoc citreum KM20]MBU7450237.1 glycoside-pentoside-hexuronide (GPH):cation symporter [Leuconostoc citreum]MCT3056894.1 MFS transporter [Leuconostoc citreum]MCT3059236.1 MFS transporter [Leuconostoc citreum]MCT3061123.1 MFS transporter [Leuconostoc citreum]
MQAKNWKQRISYALGAFGHDSYYVTLSTYFILFVSSSMFDGLPNESALIGIVTSLVVGIRLVEIFFDPLIGNVIDNTETKYGKFKPWLIVGGLVSSLALLAIFTNFGGLAERNQTLFIVLFVIVFIILDAFYSFKDIAYWSMIPAITTDTTEREKLGTVARFGSSLGANGTTMLVVPITTFFTYLATGRHEQGAAGWFWFAMIVALVSFGTAAITAWGTKENESIIRQKAPKVKTTDVFKAILKNDQLMWLALSYIAYALAYVATTGVLYLFYKFVLGQPGSFWMVGLIGTITGFVAVPLFPWLAKTITRRWVYIGSIVMQLVAYMLFIFGAKSAIIVIIATILFYFPYQLVFLSALMTITDAVEYGQLKNGVRNEAVTLSIRPLLDKIAGAFSNGIVGFITVAAGMTGHATAASVSAHGINTFNMLAFLLPGALMLFAAVIFAWRVKLTEKMHNQIVEELKANLTAK